MADTAHLLLEVRRVLRPGGRLLATVPFHGRVKAALISLGRFEAHFDPLGQHLRFYTRGSLDGTLRARGLRRRARERVGPAAPADRAHGVGRRARSGGAAGLDHVRGRGRRLRIEVVGGLEGVQRALAGR